MTQDDQAGAGGNILVREIASENGRRVRHLEIARGHTHAADTFGLSGIGAQVVCRGLPGRRRLEHDCLLGPVVKVAGRGGPQPLAQRLADQHDALSGRVRQGPKQDRVHDAENGRCQPDAQGKGEDADAAECWMAREHAKPVADVLAALIGPDGNPDGARILLHDGHVAELLQGGGLRRLRRHALVDVLLDVAGNVFADVAVQVRERMVRHAGLNTLAIARASFSHLEVSTASCLLPFAVSR